MAKTHCSAIVLVPPADVWTPIQDIRQEHDKQFRRWMPHVTLVYPFRPLKDFESLVRPLTIACQTITPFEVELAELQYFIRPQDCVLWLRPDPTEKLRQLHDALRRVVPDCDDIGAFKEGFTPHLSVGQVPKKRFLDPTLRRLRKIWKPLRFQASEVALIWRDEPPNDVFRVRFTIPLSSKVEEPRETPLVPETSS